LTPLPGGAVRFTVVSPIVLPWKMQLGGLIMVPAGVVYIVIGLWLFAAWLRESDRRLAYTQSADLLSTPLPQGGRDV
jgi:cytochrome c oxidase assembly factor CtaG